MGYYEQLYGSYPTFLIKINEGFQSENAHCPGSKRSEKKRVPRCDTGLDVHQVAKILGCKPGLVYKLVKDGKLRSRRDGRLLRFTRENVDEYIRYQEKEGPEQRQPQQRKRKKFAPAMRNQPKANELTREELDSLCL
jgi:excisionase family DNA binding protein